MIAVEVQYELNRLASSMGLYADATGKTEDQTVAKMASKLTYFLRAALKKLAPAKGSVRAERLAALKAGCGVHVRASVQRELATSLGAVTSAATGDTFYNLRGGKSGRGKVVGVSREVRDPATGKMINFQAAAVQRELTIRETARGFLAYSVPRTSAEAVTSEDRDVISRYGFTLTSFHIEVGPSVEHKHAEVRWLASQGEHFSATAGLSKPKQQEVIAEAIRETTNDTLEYVHEKVTRDIERFL